MLIFAEIFNMKKSGLFIYIIFLCNVNFAQVQNLKKYIEEGKTFDQIYLKASKFLRKAESNETFEGRRGVRCS